MSVAMDRALMALSLEDEEEELPFTMPELPGFSSSEENALSIMGRVLNPECQKNVWSDTNYAKEMAKRRKSEGGSAFPREVSVHLST